MGYVQMFAPCVACGKLFGFNPHAVPSIRVNSVREPVCMECVGAMNKKRVAAGMAPFRINTEMYEAIPEEEL